MIVLLQESRRESELREDLSALVREHESRMGEAVAEIQSLKQRIKILSENQNRDAAANKGTPTKEVGPVSSNSKTLFSLPSLDTSLLSIDGKLNVNIL